MTTPTVEVIGVAQEAAHALRDIYLRCHGNDLPRHIVDEARNPDSPLHSYFTWDDAEAAEAHRLTQATSLIRRVKVRVIQAPETEPIVARVYIAAKDTDPLTSHPSGRYVHVDEITGDRNAIENVLYSINRDIASLRRKYRSHSEFLRDALAEFLDELDNN